MSVVVELRNSLPSSCGRMFNCSQTCRSESMNRILSAAEKRSRYFRRLINVKHMDFEYAFWQMKLLLFAPQRLSRNFHYRNCSRRQWARDDPAFLVFVLSLYIFSNTVLAILRSYSVGTVFRFVLWVAVFDFLAFAFLASTFFWIITGRFLRDRSRLISPDILSDSTVIDTTQEVEWGYAFDVHLNAIFPSVVIHLFQWPLLFVILSNGIIGCFIGNSLWLIAALYYNYITFLGYSALPFLRRTAVFLWPMTAFVILFIISLIFRWNFTLFLWRFYEFRL